LAPAFRKRRIWSQAAARGGHVEREPCSHRDSVFGRHISQIQISQILKTLPKLKSLRPAGDPEFDCTFPETLRVAADI
jgi:hypothetical protein